MTNRTKSSIINNHKSQNDDDNCSIICYKDSNNGHVGVVRIRQQLTCSACNLTRGTLSLYCKHLLENSHRENVKKLCDENRFLPSIYDQIIHLAFYNNFTYQSEKFHFIYKHTNDESNQTEMEIKSMRKRRNLQITLFFQNKTYSKIGTTTVEIREQLFKDLIQDRINDISSLPIEIYYTKKKFLPENVQKNFVNLTMNKDQSQFMINKQSNEDDDLSFSELNKNENISTGENLDVDHIKKICKEVLNDILCDIYTKSGELKREQQFLSGIARRNFKKKNTFFCDICSIFLTSEKYCLQHLNGIEHNKKIRFYQMNFLPWRQTMQKALILGKSMKELMNNSDYDNYKTTMGFYLAPNSLSNRGRFCCGYCEIIFTDQWSLEKHLHTDEHKTKQTTSDHKELVLNFSNVVVLPNIFKLNGIKHLSEIPDDIKNRYQWRCVTRSQLDDDTNTFIRNYPFDTFEGVTRILNGKSSRRQKSSGKKSRNQQGRRAAFHRTRRGQFQPTNIHRGTAVKRSFPISTQPNKRFRVDLNNSFPGTNRNSEQMRNYEMEQYSFPQSMPFNNGNDRWSSNYSGNQHRQEFNEQSNYDLRSFPSDNNNNNNGYYNNRLSHQMPPKPNFEHERNQRFNGGDIGYENQQSNYDPNFIRAVAQAVAEYHPESNRSHHRAYSGPTNDFSHHSGNNLQRSTLPAMNQNPLTDYRLNNSNFSNSTYFSPSGNQQQNQIGTNNGPPIHSYGDYRTSSGNSMYSPLTSPKNSIVSPSRTFDEFGLSSIAYGRSSFSNFGHQNQIEQTPWRGNNNNNNNHGRSNTHFQSTNKRIGSTFSYSSSNSNNNHNNNSSTRGRGVAPNGRSFSGRR